MEKYGMWYEILHQLITPLTGDTLIWDPQTLSEVPVLRGCLVLIILVLVARGLLLHHEVYIYIYIYI